MDIITKTALRIVYDTRHDTNKIFVSLTTKFILRSYVLKDGTSQIYLHIHSAGERKRLALDLYIKAKHWSPAKQRAVVKGYNDFNLILDNLQSSITEIKTQFRLSQEALTLQKFEQQFMSDFSRLDFLSFMASALKEERSLISQGTHRRNKSVLEKLKSYKTKINFSEFNYQEVQNIRKYLHAIGNAASTIEGNMAVIRKYLNLAKKHGIKFPLDMSEFKVKHIRGNRVSLTPDEIKNLYYYFESPFIPNERRLILGYFLFSCFTGLRLGDIQKLQRHQIQKRFKIITGKNKMLLTVNLTEKAKHLLEIEPSLFITHISDQHINRELKDIAASVNITKKISFHVSRHSFATNYLRMGGSLVYLKKLLGHSNVNTTMIYESITQEESNKDIHLLDGLF